MSNPVTPRQVAAAWADRLATITTANGFLTNIGNTVFRGKRAIDESEVPCITLVEGNDHPKSQTRKSLQLTQTYFFEAHDVCDADHPNDKAHDMLEDLMAVVFSGGDSAFTVLNGLVKSIEYKGRTIGAREDGGTTVFAAIQIDVEYAQTLGRPA
jgi:hypothetical protein